jgi:hypothetical protein
METLPDFVRVRLRQLAYDKPPPRTLLTVLRELAQEYKVFLSGDAAKIDHQKCGARSMAFAGDMEAVSVSVLQEVHRRLIDHTGGLHCRFEVLAAR